MAKDYPGDTKEPGTWQKENWAEAKEVRRDLVDRHKIAWLEPSVTRVRMCNSTSRS